MKEFVEFAQDEHCKDELVSEIAHLDGYTGVNSEGKTLDESYFMEMFDIASRLIDGAQKPEDLERPRQIISIIDRIFLNQNLTNALNFYPVESRIKTIYEKSKLVSGILLEKREDLEK